MKASELVELIKELIDLYGDLPVNMDAGVKDKPVSSAEVYDDEGNNPGRNGKDAIEIYLHH